MIVKLVLALSVLAPNVNLMCGAEPPPNARVTVQVVDRIPNGVIVRVDGGVGWWNITLHCHNFWEIIWHESATYQYDWRWGQIDVGVECPDSHPYLWRDPPHIPPYIGPSAWR